MYWRDAVAMMASDSSASSRAPRIESRNDKEREHDRERDRERERERGLCPFN